ncbi:MAG: fatty acid desaturase [Bdellovibrionales bacterium]
MKGSIYLQVRRHLNFKTSSLYWAKHLFLDTVLLIGASVFASAGFPLTIFGALVLALLFFRAFGAMHEAVHGCLHVNGRFNDILGLGFGVLCFLPYAQWKSDHLRHHYWAGNIEKDPVMKLCLHVKNGGRISRIIEMAWRWWLPILAIMQQIVFWSNATRSSKSTRKGSSEIASLLLPIGVWTGVTFFLGGYLSLVLLLPAILFYLVLVESVNFPHHLELPQFGGDVRLAPNDQHLISRSCTYGKWFETPVLLNFNYHVEHHLFPTLPFSQLPKAYELTQKALMESHNAESGFAWIVRNRRRPLADVLYPKPADSKRDAA